ncbi:MAG: hypothetical protein V7K92_09440 [Nostoc sp.]
MSTRSFTLKGYLLVSLSIILLISVVLVRGASEAVLPNPATDVYI